MNNKRSKNSSPWRGKSKRKKIGQLVATPPGPAVQKTLDITALGAKGDGLTDYDGRQIHVPFSAPGDVARIMVAGQRGHIEELIEPSRHRAEPVCEHFGACGGCALQHLSADYQARWKQERIIEALKREGIDHDIEITPSPIIDVATRRRVMLSVQRLNDKINIGFKARNTHKIINIKHCYILHPDLFAFVQNLSALLNIVPPMWVDLGVQITHCDNGFDVNLVGDFDADTLQPDFYERLTPLMEAQKIIRFNVNGQWVLTRSAPIIHFEDIAVSIPPAAFLQVSKAGQEALLSGVKNVLKAKNVKQGAHIADLFTGCGAFALPLLKKYRVSAIDSEAGAIESLQQAYKNHHLDDKMYSLAANKRDLFRQPLDKEECSKFDAVIFDPPRAGAPAQVKQIAQTQIELIISVSCNPASFSRDARLLSKGGYKLTHIQLVDQFAFSPHIELIGTFEK